MIMKVRINPLGGFAVDYYVQTDNLKTAEITAKAQYVKEGYGKKYSVAVAPIKILMPGGMNK